MSAVLKQKFLKPDEYLAIEREAEFKSEYIDGVMYAMSGAKRNHNLIASNVIAELSVRLKQTRCEVYPSDMKVRVPDASKFFYPDIVVVCSEPEFADLEQDVLLNPLLIVEVLSKSTAAYDRGKKFEWYKQIESFREYLLIAQDEPLIEQFLKQPNGRWTKTTHLGFDAVLPLSSIHCAVALNGLYAKVF